MAKILVTGGAGFIGSHVVDRLLDHGNQVVILDDFNTYYTVENKHRNIAHHADTAALTVVTGDVSDEAAMRRLFRDHAFDGIIHLAARAGVRASIEDPLLYEQVNVRGTFLVFAMAHEFGVNDVVYASSSSVYGNRDTVPFRETDTVDHPVSPYAATKKACEEIAYTYHHLYGINTIGLRFFTVYGERGRPDMAPWKFTERILTGVPIDQYGDGSSVRDYTYIADIVDGVIRSLDRVSDIGFAVCNLGRGEPTKLTDFIATVEAVSGKSAKINYMPEQPGDVPITHADISQARELLGYEPQTSIKEGLERFVTWYTQTYNL